MGFAERSGLGGLGWALQCTTSPQHQALSGGIQLFISVNYICLGPELDLVQVKRIRRRWWRWQLGTGMLCQDIVLSGSTSLQKSDGLCWRLGQDVWETWREVTSPLVFGSPMGPWQGSLAVRGLCCWETDPYKRSCSWNVIHLVETFEMIGGRGCSDWKVTKFPNIKILCGTELCFVTFSNSGCFCYLMVWPLILWSHFSAKCKDLITRAVW